MSPPPLDLELTCPECGEVFTGQTAGMKRGIHRKAQHRESWERERNNSGGPGAGQTDPVTRGQDSFPGLHEAASSRTEGATVREEEAPSRLEEVAPHKPTRRQRLRARFGRRGGGELVSTRERAPRAARPRVHRRRVPLDMDVSDLWSLAGRRLEGGPHYATGRMLQYQGPAAGVIVDTAVAGTVLDRVVFQPIARNRNKYEDVGFLLAGPLLTFSITTTIGQMQAASEAGDQDAYDALTPKLVMQREAFGWVLSMMLPRLAAGAKLAREKKAKRDEAIADAFPELGDDDPVQVLMAMLFQPPTFEEARHDGEGASEANRNGYAGSGGGSGAAGSGLRESDSGPTNHWATDDVHL